MASGMGTDSGMVAAASMTTEHIWAARCLHPLPASRARLLGTPPFLEEETEFMKEDVACPGPYPRGQWGAHSPTETVFSTYK